METCDKKRLFHGAGAAERWWVVVDIARKKTVSRGRGDSSAILKEEGEEELRREMETQEKCAEGVQGDIYMRNSGEE